MTLDLRKGMSPDELIERLDAALAALEAYKSAADAFFSPGYRPPDYGWEEAEDAYYAVTGKQRAA